MHIIKRVIQIVLGLAYFAWVLILLSYDAPLELTLIIIIVGVMVMAAVIVKVEESIDDWRAALVNALKTPRPRTARVGKLRKAPGTRLLRFVDFFFSPKTVEHTFKPTVADWRVEYYEARNQKRFLKARWINVRYTYRFIMAMGLSKALEAVRELMKAFK